MLDAVYDDLLECLQATEPHDEPQSQKSQDNYQTTRRNLIDQEMLRYHETVQRSLTEEETLKYCDTIQKFKSKLNDFLPISRLPTETLIRILEEWRQDVDGYSVLAIVHVCSRWRAVALDYPLLWCRIIWDLNPEFVSWMMVHAKQAPLHVDLQHPEARLEWTQRLLQHEIHKVSSLTVSLLPLEITDIAPAPILKTLRLVEQERSSNERWSRMQPWKQYYDGTLTPALEHLKMVIHGSRFEWVREARWSNMKELALGHDGYDTVMNDMLIALRGMPRLESLTLVIRTIPAVENVTPPEPYNAIEDGVPVVTLEYLRLITISGPDVASVTNFLSHMHLPRAVVIALCCRHEFDTTLDFTPITHLGEFRSASLILQADRRATVVRLETRAPARALALIAFAHPENFSDIDSLLRNFPAPLLNVDDLTLQSEFDDSSLPIEPVAKFVRRMPNLRRLSICAPQAEPNTTLSILEALLLSENQAHDDAEDEDEVEDVFSLRPLELIEFREIDFRPLDSEEDEINRIHDMFSEGRCSPGYKPLFQAAEICYFKCKNVDSEIAELLREITGATRDSFVDED